MLYKVRCNPMHPLYGALPVPNVKMQVIAPLRCRASHYRRTFIPLSVSLWNDLADPVFDGVGLAALKSKDIAFIFFLSCSISFCLRLFSLSLHSVNRLVL